MGWQDDRSVTPAQYKRLIKTLGMTQGGAGRFLGISSSTSHRYCNGKTEIPTPVVLLLRSMIYHGEQPDVPRWKDTQPGAG